MSMIGCLLNRLVCEGHGLEPFYVDLTPSLVFYPCGIRVGEFQRVVGDVGVFLPSCIICKVIILAIPYRTSCNNLAIAFNYY